MSIGVFHGVGAGLFNLSAVFKAVGEPAPTGLLEMVQYLSFSEAEPLDLRYQADPGNENN
ncbi:MAG: hypothetical protein MUE44_35240 [Oscillatoriaceae cyanobacterium Prado104]|jgi:hypothetical protein|nr:hypothetical protein [Oscillatoriaceae cyanobacterium Prado104]